MPEVSNLNISDDTVVFWQDPSHASTSSGVFGHASLACACFFITLIDWVVDLHTLWIYTSKYGSWSFSASLVVDRDTPHGCFICLICFECFMNGRCTFWPIGHKHLQPGHEPSNGQARRKRTSWEKNSKSPQSCVSIIHSTAVGATCVTYCQ